jgi:membrane dipeptidase
VIVVDAHQDIAFNALGYRRDYRVSALEHRRREVGVDAATIGLPDALAGGVAVVFATLFVEPPAGLDASPPYADFTYRDPGEAAAKALAQVAFYQGLAQEDPRLRLVSTVDSLQGVLDTWAAGADGAGRLQGLVLLMEGADPVREPRELEDWVARGVRIVGPAWRRTRYSGGTGAPGPLTPLGVSLLEEMARLGVVLDLSHMAEEAFLQAVESYPGVVIASHSNPRRFQDTDRQLADDMILRLAARDGVMGIVLYNRFLSDGWMRSDGKAAVTLQTVADAVDHVCQLTGSAAHVGIGSDFDGGFGAESIPQGLDTVADLPRIGAALRTRGYTKEDVAAVMGGNMLRKLREALPAS